MRKSLILLVNICVLFVPVEAQIIQQQGFVKTIGRPDKPGEPLGNVTIQMAGMVNATTSSATGEFHLSAYNKKDGDPIKLLKVRKTDMS